MHAFALATAAAFLAGSAGAHDPNTHEPIDDPAPGVGASVPPLDGGTVAQEQGTSSIWDRLSFYANGRIRAEATFDQLNEDDDRWRGRMRFRIGSRYVIDPGLTAEARLSTASDGRDANNPHWDFGDGADGFQGGDIVFDRFYLDWQQSEQLDLRAGKQPHIFQMPPVFGELEWDEDVQPAGVTATWKPKTEGSLSGDLRVAEYIVRENSTDTDANMLGVQGNL